MRPFTRRASVGGLLYRTRYWAACLLLALLHATSASAVTIEGLRYDEAKDQLVMNINYRGTNPDHEFSVLWAECRRLDDERSQILGVLMDSQANDLAREDFTKKLEIPLKDFTCRPAKVTIRTSTNLFWSVDVPAAPVKQPPRSYGRDARNAPR
jgi:hypothetical protein